MILQINKQKIQLLFGYGALRILAKKYKLKRLSDLDKIFSKLNFKEGEEPTLEQMDVLVDLVMAGVLNADAKANVSDSEIADHIFLKNPDCLQEVMVAFSESMPVNAGKSKKG